MQKQKFSRLIKNRRAKIFNFPNASSHQILHYLDVHLSDKSINTLIIHIAINDLLTNSSTSGLGDIVSNIKKVTEKCLMFGVKNVLFKGWFTPLGWTCERVYVLILGFCRKNCFIYIDNRNIRSDSLYKTRLHLIDKGKAFLGDNFIGYLDNIFKKRTYTIHQKNFG